MKTLSVFRRVGLLFVIVAAPSASGDYTITSEKIVAGGGIIRGGAFELSATLGQPVTGVLQNGTYSLYGGRWSPNLDLIFRTNFD